MRRFGLWIYSIFALVAVLTLSSCDETVDHGGKTPLVSIGKEFLYREDIASLISSGSSKQDSIAFVEKYIAHWTEDILLYQMAQRNVAGSKEIEQLINSYKKSLLLNVYQQRLVSQQLIREITADEVANFYAANRALFKVEEPIAKGLILKVSKKAPKLGDVRKWYKSRDQKDMESMEKYSLTNADVYEYFYDRWESIPVLSSKLPISESELEGKIKNQRNFEISDSASLYFVNIEELLSKGEIKPLELAENEIKELLVNTRKADFMREVKRNLSREASERGEVIFYEPQ